jgi:hypothetical protein
VKYIETNLKRLLTIEVNAICVSELHMNLRTEHLNCIGQTGSPYHVKCNSPRPKGTMLPPPPPGSGMRIWNANNLGISSHIGVTCRTVKVNKRAVELLLRSLEQQRRLPQLVIRTCGVNVAAGREKVRRLWAEEWDTWDARNFNSRTFCWQENGADVMIMMMMMMTTTTTTTTTNRVNYRKRNRKRTVPGVNISISFHHQYIKAQTSRTSVCGPSVM